MSELLPCPFCGELPVSYDDAYSNWTIECRNVSCRATVYVCEESEQAALAKWNTRHPEPAQAQVSELEACKFLLRQAHARGFLTAVDFDSCGAVDLGGLMLVKVPAPIELECKVG